MPVKYLLFLLLIFAGLHDPENLYAQPGGQSALSFVAYVRSTPLEPGTTYIIGNDTVTIDVFRCYISPVSFYRAGQRVWSESGSYHLLDIHEPSSFNLTYSLPDEVTYDEIEFTVGIDSLTNALGVGQGDLDPVKGMYWAWQSGYVNLKLEGRNPRCTTRNHQFQYHLGGFLDGNNCAKRVRLVAKREERIKIDLSKFLVNVDFAHVPTVMSPGANARQLSESLPGMFSAMKKSTSSETD